MTRKFYETHLKWYNINTVSRVRSCVAYDRTATSHPNRPTAIHRCHEMPWRPLECAVILKNAIATACVLSFRCSSYTVTAAAPNTTQASVFYYTHAPRWALIRSILLEIDEPLFAVWTVDEDEDDDDRNGNDIQKCQPHVDSSAIYIFSEDCLSVYFDSIANNFLFFFSRVFSRARLMHTNILVRVLYYIRMGPQLFFMSICLPNTAKLSFHLSILFVPLKPIDIRILCVHSPFVVWLSRLAHWTKPNWMCMRMTIYSYWMQTAFLIRHWMMIMNIADRKI